MADFRYERLKNARKYRLIVKLLLSCRKSGSLGQMAMSENF